MTNAISIVATADTHIHNFSAFAVRGNSYSRLEDAIEVLNKIADVVLKEAQGGKDVFFVHLGDVFDIHDPLHNKVVAPYLDFAEKIAPYIKKHIILGGNHDKCHLNSSVKTMGKVPGIDVMCSLKSIEVGGIPCTFAPWGYELPKRYQGGILFSHAEISGAIMGSDYICRGSTINFSPKNYMLSLFGHFHRHQQLADNAWYIGSPLQLNMGERGDKKYIAVVVNIKDNDYDLRWVENNFSPKMVQLEDIGDSRKLEGIMGNYVRVLSSLPKEHSEFKNILAILERDAKSFDLLPMNTTPIVERMDIGFEDDFEEIVNKVLEYKKIGELNKGKLKEIAKEIFI